MSADLVCPALNNVLLVSTGLGTAAVSVSVLVSGMSVLVSALPVLITSLPTCISPLGPTCLRLTFACKGAIVPPCIG
jgi:hypothetical protein